MSQIWKFILKDVDSTLPEEISEFLDRHSVNTAIFEDIYGVTRNTSTRWFSWRRTLQNESFLQKIEANCASNMQRMGYVSLGTIQVLKQIDTFPSIIPYT